MLEVDNAEEGGGGGLGSIAQCWDVANEQIFASKLLKCHQASIGTDLCAFGEVQVVELESGGCRGG